MFKQLFSTAVRVASLSTRPNSKLLIQNVIKPTVIQPIFARNFNSLLNNQNAFIFPKILSENPNPQISNTTVRTVTKFSMRKGKRKSVKAVLRSFYRLHWGGWIRTKCGRNKKLWKKSPPRKRRLRQHVLCNGQQSYLLDKMVGPYWRKRKYYVDDPYEPYHQRNEWEITRLKPKPYFPPEEINVASK